MTNIVKGVVLALSALAFIATLLPLIKAEAWWIRVCDFPRVQIAVIAALMLLAYFFVFPRQGWYLSIPILMGLVIIVQAVQIYPYTFLAKPQVKKVDTKPDLTIMVSNVRQKNTEYKRVLETIRQRDPALVLLLEVNKEWVHNLTDLESEYPHIIAEPLENTYGIILYSKLQLSESKVRYLVEEDVPSIFTKIHLENGKIIDFYGLHPKPPQPGNDTEERDAELVIVGKEIKEKDRVAVVAGDLNDVAWSHTTRLFQRLSSTLDPRVGRGMYNTFNANLPLLRFPLDHIFHTSEFRLRKIERMGDVGSDHFPIYTELKFLPDAEQENGKPKPSPEDHKEGNEKVSKATSK